MAVHTNNTQNRGSLYSVQHVYQILVGMCSKSYVRSMRNTACLLLADVHKHHPLNCLGQKGSRRGAADAGGGGAASGACGDAGGGGQEEAAGNAGVRAWWLSGRLGVVAVRTSAISQAAGRWELCSEGGELAMQEEVDYNRQLGHAAGDAGGRMC